MAMAADSLEGVPRRNCTDLRTFLMQEQNERARRRVLRILFCFCERNIFKPRIIFVCIADTFVNNTTIIAFH